MTNNTEALPPLPDIVVRAACANGEVQVADSTGTVHRLTFMRLVQITPETVG